MRLPRASTVIDTRTSDAIDKFVEGVEMMCIATDAHFDLTEKCYEPSHPIYLMGRKPGPIPILDYVKRFVCYTGMKAEDLACAMSYLDRIAKIAPIGPRSVHRAVAGVLAYAHVSRYDACYGVRYIAMVCGVPLDEMLRIKTCVLLMLQCNLSVTAETMASKLDDWGVSTE